VTPKPADDFVVDFLKMWQAALAADERNPGLASDQVTEMLQSLDDGDLIRATLLPWDLHCSLVEPDWLPALAHLFDLQHVATMLAFSRFAHEEWNAAFDAHTEWIKDADAFTEAVDVVRRVMADLFELHGVTTLSELVRSRLGEFRG